MYQKSIRWKGLIFLMLLTAFLMLGGKQEAYAASTCKVTYADSRGKVSAQKYEDWAKKVKRGEQVTLPRVKASSAYRYYWIQKDGNVDRRRSSCGIGEWIAS